MPNYKEMYFMLFSAVSHAIEQLQNAQRHAENMYIESQDENQTILASIKDKIEIGNE